MRKATLLTLVAVLSSATSLALAEIGRPGTPERKGLFSQSDVEKVWKTAVAKRKPMLVMFTSEHCGYCDKMLADTYGHPGIRQMLAARTETVLAHAEDYRGLTKKLGIRGYPTSLLISPQGEVLEFMQGYVDPKAFAERVGPVLAAHNARTLATANAVSRSTSER